MAKFYNKKLKYWIWMSNKLLLDLTLDIYVLLNILFFANVSTNVFLFLLFQVWTSKLPRRKCDQKWTKMKETLKQKATTMTFTINWTFLLLIFLHMVALASPRTFNSQKTFVTREKRHTMLVTREKRHTPFLPGDYWKDNRPDFGSTETTLNVMENSTAKFKCPITHVADSSVSCLRPPVNDSAT